MTDAIQLNWSLKSKEIKWVYNGVEQLKLFNYPISNAIPLENGSGFVTIEEVTVLGSDNAAIWNGDGSLRCRPGNPFGPKSEFSFYYAERIKNRLHLILASRDRDFGVFINEDTCEIIEKHEAR